MKILLDTHMLIWTLTDSPKLSAKARELILQMGNEIYYSTVSLWEIEIKRLAKPESLPITAKIISGYCSEAGFKQFLLKESSIYMLSKLNRPEYAPPHKDPFDRILISQSVDEGAYFLTHDTLLKYYNVPNIILA